MPDDSQVTRPRASHSATLRIGSVELECHVLDTGSRVLGARQMVAALTGGVAKGRDFSRLMERIPNVPDELKVSPRIEFIAAGGIHHGYEATLLVDIVHAYVDALIEGTLHPKQRPIAERCRVIERALGKVAIDALIDEATGYQSVRAPDALQAKLAQYLLGEFRDWERTFPAEFFREVCRLYGYEYTAGRNPPFMRWFVRRFVYDAIDAEVAVAQKKRNPNPREGSNHHQLWTDAARPLLASHIGRVIALVRTSYNPAKFYEAFRVEFGGASGIQGDLCLDAAIGTP